MGSNGEYTEDGHLDEDLDHLSLSDVGYNPSRISFLTLTSPISSSLPSPAPGQAQCQPLLFRSSAELLAHITKHWRSNFVTLDLDTKEVLAEFLTRPFVLVVSVDAPLLMRYRRSLEWFVDLTSLRLRSTRCSRPSAGLTLVTRWKSLSESMTHSSTVQATTVAKILPIRIPCHSNKLPRLRFEV